MARFVIQADVVVLVFLLVSQWASALCAAGPLEGARNSWKTLVEAKIAMRKLPVPNTSSAICEYAQCLIDLAAAFGNCGRWHDAEAILGSVLELCESDDVRAALHWQRCCTRLSLLDYSGAAAEAQRCTYYAPFSYPLAYHWIARDKWQQGTMRQAIGLWLDGLRVTRPHTVIQYLDLLAPYLVFFDEQDVVAYYDTLLALLEKPTRDNAPALQRVLLELVKVSRVFPERFSALDVTPMLAALPTFDAPARQYLLNPRSNAHVRVACSLLHTTSVEEALTRWLCVLRDPQSPHRALGREPAVIEKLCGAVACVTNAAMRVDGLLPRTLAVYLTALAEIQAWTYSGHTRSQALQCVASEISYLQRDMRTQAELDYLAQLRMCEAILLDLLHDRDGAADAWAAFHALTPMSIRSAVPNRVIEAAPDIITNQRLSLPHMIVALLTSSSGSNQRLSTLACAVARQDIADSFWVQTNGVSATQRLLAGMIEMGRETPFTFAEQVGEGHESCPVWDNILAFLMSERARGCIVEDATLCEAARDLARRLAISVPAIRDAEHVRRLRSLMTWYRALAPARYDQPMSVIVECDARHWPAGLTPCLSSDLMPAARPMQPTEQSGIWQQRLVFPAQTAALRLSFLSNAAAAPAAEWRHTVRRDDCVGEPLRVRLLAPRIVPVLVSVICDARHLRNIRQIYLLGDHPSLGAWLPNGAIALHDNGRAGDNIARDGKWSCSIMIEPDVRELRFICVAQPAALEDGGAPRHAAFVRRYAIADNCGPTSTCSFTYGHIYQ